LTDNLDAIETYIQISRGNFGYGKIIQLHTVGERYYAIIKQPQNGNKKQKKLQKK